MTERDRPDAPPSVDDRVGRLSPEKRRLLEMLREAEEAEEAEEGGGAPPTDPPPADAPPSSSWTEAWRAWQETARSDWTPGSWNPGSWNPGSWTAGAGTPGAGESNPWTAGAWNPGTWNPGAWNPGAWNPAAGQAPGASTWASTFNPALFNPALFNPALFNPALFEAWRQAQGATSTATPPPDAGAAHEPLVELKPSGDRRPLFLVAPMLGSVWPYHQLALHIDPAQPLYGLQSAAATGGAASSTITDAAREYVRTIRRRQLRGPYLVGGYSFGGWAAFEIARLLLEAGEEVAFLGMLGTCAPPSVAAPLAAKAFDAAVEHFEAQSRLHRDMAMSDEERATRAQEVGSSQAGGAGFGGSGGFEGFGSPGGGGTWQQKSAAAHAFAALRYTPRPIECGLSLFLTADLTSTVDHTAGWWLLCTREIDVQVHSGHHLNTFTEPHVRDLARVLNARLDSIHAQLGARPAAADPRRGPEEPP